MDQNGEFKGSTQARLSEIERRLDAIESNHLPHIQSEIEKVNNKIDRFQWWLVLLFGGIISSLIVQIVKN